MRPPTGCRDAGKAGLGATICKGCGLGRGKGLLSVGDAAGSRSACGQGSERRSRGARENGVPSLASRPATDLHSGGREEALVRG